MSTPFVTVVAGPTASGKTALAIKLALEKGGEIVSADSMQIYKGMDIGTAKATVQEQAMVPHHMIDIVTPFEDYSVSMFVDDASSCIDDILSRGKLPVIVGGTGLYIDSLLSGRTFSERFDDESVRQSLNLRYDTVGGEQMLSELSEFDPDRASILHAQDKKRIVRAFEVYLVSGKTITEHDLETKSIPPRYSCDYYVTGAHDRSFLYSRIDRRVDDMISLGLEDEVRSLLSSGVPQTSTAMQAIGYKEMVSYINGDCTLDDAVSLIKQSSRRYAKRQITWFGRREDAIRIYIDT